MSGMVATHSATTYDGMQIGYARVSTIEQETDMQRLALKRVRVSKVYEEKRSAVATRPMLVAMLDTLRPGDVVHVYKLDRLARSLRDLLAILDRIESAGAGLRSCTEPVDTTTPAGRMLMQMIGAFAEFERAIIRERTMAGLEAARERGSRFGRARALTPTEEVACARLYSSGKHTKSELARRYGCSVSSIKRTLARVGLDSVSERHALGGVGIAARGLRRLARTRGQKREGPSST